MDCKYRYDGKWTAEPPPADRILETLKQGHPRLMIDDDLLTRVKADITGDQVAARIYEAVKGQAEDILSQPPSEYEIPDGRRLLGVSRRVKERVRALMFVHLLGDGGQEYVDRVWAEIDAVVQFKDWNPSHFLDTAEMTHAVGLSLDWLFDRWTDDQRRAMREAIISHGLEPGMRVYQGKERHRWDRNTNNWNQVCNGGLSAGALAIADEHPLVASQILEQALQSIPRAMSYYAPDGGGTEGVTYWSYGMRYNLVFLSSLETALGTDFGLSGIEGFKESGSYHMYMSGPDRVSFNFGDCGLARMSAPMHFWLGRRYGVPEYSWFRYSELEHSVQTGSVLDLLWFDGSAKSCDLSTFPLDKHHRKHENASMRSAWGDPDALAVGFEAGHNTLGGHRHQDIGSFILDALGERWVVDSGTESQTYQAHRHGRKRWEFYRVRGEGHNTLVMNPGEGPDQVIDAMCPIVGLDSETDGPAATADLSAVYAEHARSVQRTVALPGRKSVVVTDEVSADRPIEQLWWFAHTKANVEVSEAGREATLRQNGKELVVSIASGPADAVFQQVDAAPLPTSPNPPENTPNEGLTKLAIHLEGVSELKLSVAFEPVWG